MKKTALSLGKKLLALSIVVGLVVLTACGGGTTPAASSPAASKPVASSPAGTSSPKPSSSKITIQKPPLKGPPKWGGILAPLDGATVLNNNPFVLLDYGNFNIVAPSATNKEGEGHIIFYLDIDPITTAGAKANATPAGSKGKIYVGSSGTVDQQMGYQWKNIPNGNHTLGAQLVQNDDTPFNPPLFGQVKVDIQGKFPSGFPPSPTPSPK